MKARSSGRLASVPAPAIILALGAIAAGATTTALAGQAAPETPAVLQEVVVTGTRTPHTLKDVPVETVVVSREDIARTNAQNTMAVLASIPGVSTSAHDDTFGTYTWHATMRGLSFNDGYALILVDGERVMGPGQSGGMGEYGIGLNQIPVEMIERIEVVKGPGSALYGSDAMAGVINIITRRIPKKQVIGVGAAHGWYTVKERIKNNVVQKPSQQNRNQSQAYVYFGDHPLEKIGYLLQYNYESAQDSGRSRIDSERHSLLAKVDADLTGRTKLSVKGEVSDYEKKDNRKEESYRLSTRVNWQAGEEHLFSLKGFTYNWNFNHGFVDNTYGHKYGDIAYHQAEGQYTWLANETHALTSGAEFQRQSIDYTIDNPDGSRVAVNRDVDIFSLYLQDEITLLDGEMSLVPGIRYDDHSTFGAEFNPKLSAMYRLSGATTLRASVGRAFKSPTIRQLYYDAPYNHGSFYAQSNPGLKPETAIGYSVGVEQWLRENSIMFSAGYFRNQVKELVIREDSGTLYNGKPLLLYRNVEEATIQGIEILSRIWPAEDLSLAISYTYTDSENKENGNNLTYTPEHQLSLTPAYELPDYGLGMSATISCNSKQYTNTANTAQINGHTVVDAKIYKQLGPTAKLSLEADNVFDSDKGDEANFRTGRTFMVKLDFSF
ncbi:MAG: TonB-dependent receptor [Desulfobacterales bacterium]|nr:TonB-dependent receptor [Desulfobacterales bacterium]